MESCADKLPVEKGKCEIMEIIKCIVKGMELYPEDDKIHRFCAKIVDGTAVEMKLSVWESGRSESASR